MLPKKKVYWKSRKSQPKIAFATLCCIYAVCVQLMLHTWIRIDWCIFEHVIIFIRNIPFAPYSRADPCLRRKQAPETNFTYTNPFQNISKPKLWVFFSLNRQESQHQVLLTERNLNAARYIKRVTLKSSSCRKAWNALQLLTLVAVFTPFSVWTVIEWNSYFSSLGFFLVPWHGLREANALPA